MRDSSGRDVSSAKSMNRPDNPASASKLSTFDVMAAMAGNGSCMRSAMQTAWKRPQMIPLASLARRAANASCVRIAPA